MIGRTTCPAEASAKEERRGKEIKEKIERIFYPEDPFYPLLLR